MGERVREVQRAREEALGQREEAVERREKDVREREKKVVELKQAIDEREHALDQGGSELEERVKWVENLEEEMETCSAQLGGLNASTSAPWSITLLRVIFCVLGDKTSSFLLCSCPPFSPKPNSSSSPNPSTTTPSPSSSITPSKKTPARTGSPTRSIPLNGWTEGLPHTRGHWCVCCCAKGACKEVNWGWDVELVGREAQEVAQELGA